MVACGQTQTETGFGNQSDLFKKFINSEFTEVYDAYTERYNLNVAKELADLRGIMEGLEHTLVIPQQEDGKILKPDSYSPAEIGEIFDATSN